MRVNINKFTWKIFNKAININHIWKYAAQSQLSECLILNLQSDYYKYNYSDAQRHM